MPNLLCSSVLHSAARHTLEATAGRRPPQSKTYWRRTPMMGTVVKVLVAELPRMAMGKAVLVPDLQRHYTTNWGRIVMVAVVVVLLRAQHMPMLPTAARSRSTCHKGCSGATAGHPPRQTVRLILDTTAAPLLTCLRTPGMRRRVTREHWMPPTASRLYRQELMTKRTHRKRRRHHSTPT